MAFPINRYVRFPRNPRNQAFLDIAPSDARLLIRTTLYRVLPSGEAEIVKAEGLGWEEAEKGDLEKIDLSFFHLDRELVVEEIQAAMIDGLLLDLVARGMVEELRRSFATMLDEAFNKPTVQTILGFRDMVGILVKEFEQDPVFLRSFQMAASAGFGVADHSINVMALTAGVCLREGHALAEVHDYALASLMHDIGRSSLPEGLRNPKRRLTDDEFSQYRMHPVHGAGIVAAAGVSGKLLRGIQEHHERIDGSGYPSGIHDVSWIGQVVGLADCYDALTAPRYLGRQGMDPLEVLRLLRQEMGEGKFQGELFKRFAYSLVE